MTTTCSVWRFVWFAALQTACAPARPAELSKPDAVGATSPPIVTRVQTPPSATRGETVSVPYDRWTELSHGPGNGHAISAVHLPTVTILASSALANAYYCEPRLLEHGATFGVAESILLEDERRLYYIIERVNAAWRYAVHIDGETILGSALCAACHEQGRSDPFFRPFREVVCH